MRLPHLSSLLSLRRTLPQNDEWSVWIEQDSETNLHFFARLFNDFLLPLSQQSLKRPLCRHTLKYAEASWMVRLLLGCCGSPQSNWPTITRREEEDHGHVWTPFHQQFVRVKPVRQVLPHRLSPQLCDPTLKYFWVCSVNSYLQYGPGGCADCAVGLESSPSPSCPENKYLINRSLLIAHFLIWAVYPLQSICEGDQNSKYHRYSWDVSSNKHLKRINLIQIWSYTANIQSVGFPNLG